jgi:hypothetical protein
VDAFEELDGWLTLAEAALLAERPRSTFDLAVRRGELPFVEVAATRYFHESDIADWKRRQAGSQAPAAQQDAMAAEAA